MADGSIAVGIFNLGDKDQKVDIKALIPTDKPTKVIRDVWRQKDLSADELGIHIGMLPTWGRWRNDNTSHPEKHLNR